MIYGTLMVQARGFHRLYTWLISCSVLRYVSTAIRLIYAAGHRCQTGLKHEPDIR